MTGTSLTPEQLQEIREWWGRRPQVATSAPRDIEALLAHISHLEGRHEAVMAYLVEADRYYVKFRNSPARTDPPSLYGYIANALKVAATYQSTAKPPEDAPR